MTFLLSSENMVFAISIVLMLGIAVLEGVMVVLGGGLSQLFDALLPDTLDGGLGGDTVMESPVDTGSDAGFGHEGALSRLLGWLYFGRVPALILLVSFLCIFGLSGYAIQAMAQTVSGHLIPGALAWLPAFGVTLPIVRLCARGLANIIPQESSDAVSIDSLIGRIAVIVTGTAAQGRPAQARLKDQFATTHYIMVEPDLPGLEFSSGTPVLLVSRNGPWFRAILPPNPHLLDPSG
jgi:hypothetical protein